MATLRDIAKAAGVSVYTASMVVNGRAREGRISVRTAEEIARLAQSMQYRPNAAARAMASRRTRQIGVLVPNNPGNRFTHPLAYETISGINEGLQASGYVMCLARIDDVRQDLAQQSRVFKEHLLDGMIVLDSMPTEVERRLETLIPHVVWCDSNVWRDVGCLRRDELQAGHLAGQAAVKSGYDKLVMMTYTPENMVHFSARQRYQGVKEQVEAAGRELSIIAEPIIGDKHTRLRTAKALTPDTVLLCNSVYQAHTIRSIAEETGRIPGRDFGLICCDDMHQLDRLWPGLARVSFDRYQMGLDAAAMLTGSLEDGIEHHASKLLVVNWIPGSTLVDQRTLDAQP
ncbi:MAG: LacI family transcriptional regulator [Phycisphaerales bacterium]|nr:LacI family transcriptional regulator [Phycisphaerales bacterium]